ncbi:MAG: HEAT repeat domain-containing protein [Candidatus Helarchaeota archaeon]
MNLEDLIKKLETSDENIISETLDQIGDSNSPAAIPALLEFLEQNLNDPDIIDATIWTLARICPLEVLTNLLEHSNKHVALNCIDAIGRRGDKEAVPQLLPFMESTDTELRTNATWAIGKLRDPNTKNALLKRLKNDEDPEIRAHAAWGLGNLVAPDLLPVLEEIKKKERDDSVLYQLEDALQKIRNESSISQIKRLVFSYECPKLHAECLVRKKKQEVQHDKHVRLEFEICEECEFGRICRISIKK